MSRSNLILLLLLLPMSTLTIPGASAEDAETSSSSATIDDSWTINPSKTKAEIFYIRSIDGEKVPNAHSEMFRKGRVLGSGFKITTGNRSRKVNAQSIVLELAASVYLNAPIAYAFNAGKNFHIDGKIVFVPEADGYYVVKGTLREDYRAVWLENIDGVVVSDRIVARGKQDRKALVEIEKLPPGEIPERANSGNEATSESAAETRTDELARVRRMLRINIGDTMTSVMALLGEPESKELYDRYGGIKKRQTFNYGPLGSVTFSTSNEEVASVAQVAPEVVWLYSTYGMEFLEAVFETKNTAALSRYVSALGRIKFFPPEAESFLGRALEANMLTDDDYMANAMAHVCHILARSTRSDFAPLLSRVVNEAGERRLVRHAKKALKRHQAHKPISTDHTSAGAL